MRHARLAFWTLFLTASATVAFAAYSDGAEQPIRSTRCVDGEPVLWIRPDLSPAEKAQVARHEARHVEQAQALGCERFSELVETPEGWLQLEAEAYCADIREMMTELGMREEADVLIERFLTVRQYQRVQRLGREHGEHIIHAVCRPVRGTLPVRASCHVY
jgi:hypothetical protein